MGVAPAASRAGPKGRYSLAIGPPACFQAAMPPAMLTAFLIPMSTKVLVPIAERPPRGAENDQALTAGEFRFVHRALRIGDEFEEAPRGVDRTGDGALGAFGGFADIH